jgi:hypothetical protein
MQVAKNSFLSSRDRILPVGRQGGEILKNVYYSRDFSTTLCFARNDTVLSFRKEERLRNLIIKNITIKQVDFSIA